MSARPAPPSLTRPSLDLTSLAPLFHSPLIFILPHQSNPSRRVPAPPSTRTCRTSGYTNKASASLANRDSQDSGVQEQFAGGGKEKADLHVPSPEEHVFDGIVRELVAGFFERWDRQPPVDTPLRPVFKKSGALHALGGFGDDGHFAALAVQARATLIVFDTSEKTVRTGIFDDDGGPYHNGCRMFLYKPSKAAIERHNHPLMHAEKHGDDMVAIYATYLVRANDPVFPHACPPV